MTKPLSSVLFDWGPWIFNLGLVIVGALQVWLLKVTWKTIRLQVNLQNFGLRQWADIGSWKLHEAEPRSESGDLKDFLSLQYTFFLYNRTSAPISLKRVMAQVTSGGRCETFEIDEETFIPPFEPSMGNAFMCFLPINLYGKEVGLYEQSKFLFEIKGQLFFEDGKGTTYPQPFRRTVKCGPKLEEVYVYVGRNFKPVGAESTEKNDPQAGGPPLIQPKTFGGSIP